MKDFENYELSGNEYIEIHDIYEDEFDKDENIEKNFEVESEEVEIKDTYME